jgi:hypothetical protein
MRRKPRRSWPGDERLRRAGVRTPGTKTVARAAYGARTIKLAFLGRFKTAGKAKEAAERHSASAGGRSQPSGRAGHRIGRPASGCGIDPKIGR